MRSSARGGPNGKGVRSLKHRAPDPYHREDVLRSPPSGGGYLAGGAALTTAFGGDVFGRFGR